MRFLDRQQNDDCCWRVDYDATVAESGMIKSLYTLSSDTKLISAYFEDVL